MFITINNRFIINRRVGRGSFGDVYLGHDKDTHKIVALKLEHNSNKLMLEHEYNVYQQISHKGMKIPKIWWYGLEGEYRVIVMDFLGDSLDGLLKRCNNHFSLKTTIMIGIQIFDLLHHLHRCNFIHRDIKPENFLIGIGEERHFIYMIDYGLAKQFKDNRRFHMKMVTGKKLVGTARYASINSHNGIGISRRDDLESLIYLLIYCIRGNLPWQGLPGNTREEKYEAIKQSKMTTSNRSLTNGLPEELFFFLDHVKSLSFRDKPNYKYLRDLLVNIMKSNHFEMDYKYDWTTQ